MSSTIFRWTTLWFHCGKNWGIIWIKLL